MRCAGCLPGNKLACVSSPNCHISSMAPQGHSRGSQPSCYQAGRQPAAKTCLQEAACWGLREQGRMGAGPWLMQLPVPGAGRFPGPRRACSVDHPRQVPRLQPGPRGRSWRRWAGASASRWAPVTSQPVPEPQAGPEASVLSGASLVPGRAFLPAYLPSCHTSSS